LICSSTEFANNMTTAGARALFSLAAARVFTLVRVAGGDWGSSHCSWAIMMPAQLASRARVGRRTARTAWAKTGGRWKAMYPTPKAASHKAAETRTRPSSYDTTLGRRAACAEFGGRTYATPRVFRCPSDPGTRSRRRSLPADIAQDSRPLEATSSIPSGWGPAADGPDPDAHWRRFRRRWRGTPSMGGEAQSTGPAGQESTGQRGREHLIADGHVGWAESESLGTTCRPGGPVPAGKLA